MEFVNSALMRMNFSQGKEKPLAVGNGNHLDGNDFMVLF